MYCENNIKRSWVEIDLEQLKKNYLIYKENLPQNSKIVAVVKADAYGHGDVKISKTLMKLGVDYFAVSNLEEAKRLRKNNIKGEILILGYTPIEYMQEIIEYDITQTLVSEEYAELILSTKLCIKCQFAIDTGMNRIGLNANDIDYCEKIIKKYHSLLNLNGIFTHLCVADSNKKEDEEFTQLQISKFENIANRIKDLRLPYIHFSNSAGGMFYVKETSIVRLGIILYGIAPNISTTLPNGICPILSWKSVLSMIKCVDKGESIGYGRTYIADKKRWIATIPTGYADGYCRKFSNIGYVLIRGYKVPIVGQICMDQMMVDITNLVVNEKKELSIGEEVILIGRSQNEEIEVNKMANQIGTIGYEIVSGISKRVARIYKKNEG